LPLSRCAGTVEPSEPKYNNGTRFPIHLIAQNKHTPIRKHLNDFEVHPALILADAEISAIEKWTGRCDLFL
jgi:hypothetical protein